MAKVGLSRGPYVTSCSWVVGVSYGEFLFVCVGVAALLPPGLDRSCASRVVSHSIEPWRPRDVRRAGRRPPRRVARGSPAVRPSAVRRRAAPSAVPAAASPRRAVTMTPRRPEG